MSFEVSVSFSTESIQTRFAALHQNKFFELTVIFIIVISALMVGVKTYDVYPGLITLMNWLDIGVTVLFSIEILTRMIAAGSLRAFFSKGWNIFDFVIVTGSLIPLGNGQMVLLGRLLRIFRVLRLISMIPELQILLTAFMKSIPRMGYVSLLMFIIFYIYAAFGSIFFSNINETLWGNISVSLLTLFRVATFEDWTDVMYETMDVYPISWMYYLTFIFIVAFVFLNMMIGIVLDVMQKEHERYDMEHEEGEAGEVHWLRIHNELMEQRLVKMEAMLERIEKQTSTTIAKESQ